MYFGKYQTLYQHQYATQSAGKPDPRLRASNHELRPMLLPMRADELVFGTAQLEAHSNGHCFCIAMSSRGQLTRRLYTADHPRLVPMHFTVAGAKANKVYIYHLTAFAAAYIQEMNPSWFTDRGITIIPLRQLQTITKGKTQLSTVLCHGWGNKWCMNPRHFHFATKAANDLEEHCHYFLRQVSTLHQYSNWQHDWCTLFHKKAADWPCWTNAYNAAQLQASRLSVSCVPEVDEEDGN